jgi:hypothetical protein
MIFDKRVAVVLLEDLATWQKLNVTAFLATGIADAAPDAMGEPYVDAAGNGYARLLGQPIMIHAANQQILRRVREQALQRHLQCAAYVRAMFESGHDEANREAFLLDPADAMDLVGIAVRGPAKDIQRAVKGAPLHT